MKPICKHNRSYHEDAIGDLFCDDCNANLMDYEDYDEDDDEEAARGIPTGEALGIFICLALLLIALIVT